MNPRIFFLAAALSISSIGSFGCAADQAEDDVDNSEDAVAALDNIGAPTDTKVTLVAGRWHDNVLTPREGWHAYHFMPTESGYVRFVMKAEIGHANMWSYLRIELEDPAKVKPWLHNTAAVGNTRTNLCEIIMKVEAGQKYDVITTSQFNLTNLTPGRHKSDGKYTVAVLPIDSTIQIPE
jgi:hypothetical protein